VQYVFEDETHAFGKALEHNQVGRQLTSGDAWSVYMLAYFY